MRVTGAAKTTGIGMADPDAGSRPRGGTREVAYRCALCSTSTSRFGYDCAACGGPLLAEPGPVDDVVAAPSGVGVWRYPWLLPRTRAAVTLGEGGTPLIPLTARSRAGRAVLGKLESLNPTLSFKDRAMAVGASMALDLGARGIVVASTGNAAVSASAYAAAAGLPCRVLVGTESNAAKKLDACRALGAEVEEVAGDYSAAYARARRHEDEGWMNVSTTYRNPVLAEGYRSIAFELVEQLGRAPAAVIVPIGAGPLLRGIERGFDDARTAGLADRTPALVGVQAARVAPIHRAWQARRQAAPESIDPWAPATLPEESGPTIATAIADRLTGYSSHGDITIRAVERTGGDVVAVSEEQIVTAARALAAAGVWVEPSAATSLAALEVWTDRRPAAGHPHDDGPVVLMLTGHGAKAPGLPPS
jgi:threonine synthase